MAELASMMNIGKEMAKKLDSVGIEVVFLSAILEADADNLYHRLFSPQLLNPQCLKHSRAQPAGNLAAVDVEHRCPP